MPRHAAADPPPKERRGASLDELERFCAGRGDRPGRLRHPPLARGRREPVRRPHPLLRRQVRGRDGLPVRFHEETLTSDEAARRLPRRATETRPRTSTATGGRGGAPRGLPARAVGRRGPLSAGRRDPASRPAPRPAALRRGALPALPPPRASPAPAGSGGGTSLLPLRDLDPEIFRRLAAEGVVSPAWLAEAYYRLARSATPLQAGEYRFARPTALSEVIDRMARGDVVQHTIVVPEGLTAEETFELFWSRGIRRPRPSGRAFTNPRARRLRSRRGAPDLEGFLFPDTYVVTRSTSARQIVESDGRQLPPALHARDARARRGAWA